MDSRAQTKIYIDIVFRRWPWLVVPAILGLAISLVMLSRMPKIYRAETTVLVTRQSMPDDIVRSTVTLRIEERMNSLKVQVLSNAYLEQIVQEFKLVPPEATAAEIEKACGKVRGQVSIELQKPGYSWFKIFVTDAEPKRAAGIANRLAQMFIEQNTKMRTAQAETTVETIEGWLATTKETLDQKEREIAAFKQQHLYELPEQQAATLTLLNAAQNRVSDLSNDIQLKTDRLAAARMEAQTRLALDAATGVPTAIDDPDGRALAQMEKELADLLVNYTDENPLVRRKRDQIAAFKASHPAVAVRSDPGSGEPAIVAPPLLAAEISRLQSEIRVLEAERAQELTRIEQARSRLNNIPIRQQQLAELTRGYEPLKAEYDKTMGQRQQANRSKDIEEGRKGEQFQVQDRARPPAVPYSPQPLVVILTGLLGGLALGAGVVALFEFLDASIRSEEAFAVAFPGVLVIGAIPNLDGTAQDEGGKKKHRKGKGRQAAALIALVLSAAASYVAGQGGLS